MRGTSRIELSRAALRKNLRFLRRRIGEGVRFTSVVKGNAYGHGLDVFVPLAEECGVDSFAVFSADEALEVLRARQGLSDVMIMGAVDEPQLEWALEHEVSFHVFERSRLQGARDAARRIGKPARVHLDLETGMHRLGLEQDDLEAVATVLRESPECFTVEGVCTHFAGAESASNYLRIHRQIERFRELVAELRAAGVTPRRCHTACSAAALTYPETIMDMVRIGIAHYGYWPSKEVQIQLALEQEAKEHHRWSDPLKRVISWKSHVMVTKVVKPGEFIGYGTSYLSNRRMKIAVVPVGYGDGFRRSLSNSGRVLIRGRRFAVIGFVNMSMMTVDVTDLPEICPGDEVVLIGKQGKYEISVASFSEMSEFLNYEMLVRLPREIQRLVVE